MRQLSVQSPFLLILLLVSAALAQNESPVQQRPLPIEGDIFFHEGAGELRIVADRCEVTAGDSKGKFLSFPVTEDFPDSVSSISAVPRVDFGYLKGNHVATTGLRSYHGVELRNSNKSAIMESAIGPDGSRIPVTFHQPKEPSTGRIFQLVSAGDFLMLSADRWQDDGVGFFIEIYQTLPTLKFEQKLTAANVPSERTQHGFGCRMAADENTLVVGNRPWGADQLTLSIFERKTGSSPWVLLDVEKVSSRNQGSDYLIDTDGRTIALLFYDENSVQKIKTFTRREDGKFAEEQIILKEDIRPDLIETTLYNIAVDSGQIVVSAPFQSDSVGSTAALHVLEKNGDNWQSRGFLTSDFRKLSVEFFDVSDGFVYATESNLVMRFDIRNPMSKSPDFAGQPVLKTPANGTLRDQLALKGDLSSITARIVEAPSWISLLKEGDVWILGGTTPPETGTELVHLELIDGLGRKAFRTYDLEILPGSAAPVVTGVEGEGDLLAGVELLLTAQFTGAAPLTFQWSKDGVPLEGQTSRSLELINAFPEDAGSYSVMVSNVVGSAESEMFEVTVGEGMTSPRLMAGLLLITTEGCFPGSVASSRKSIRSRAKTFPLPEVSARDHPLALALAAILIPSR